MISVHKAMKGFFAPNAIFFDPAISPITLKVYMILLKMSNKYDSVYPKQETLAKKLGIDERTIQRSIRDLRREGYIEVIPPTGQDRFMHRNNQYKIVFGPKFYPDDKFVGSVNDSHVGSNILVSSNINSFSKEKDNTDSKEPESGGPTLPNQSLADELENNNLDNSFIEAEIEMSRIYSATAPQPPPPTKKIYMTGAEKLNTEINELKSSCRQRHEEWFDYWRTKDGLHQYVKTVSKSINKACYFIDKLMDGTLFNHLNTIPEMHNKVFTIDMFKQSVDNFHQMVTDPTVWPMNKIPLKRMSMDQFIFNNITGKTMLITALYNPPKKLASTIFRETDPTMTDYFMKKYKDQIDEFIEDSERPKFIKTINQLLEVKKKLDDANRFRSHTLRNPETFINNFMRYMINTKIRILGTGLREVEYKKFVKWLEKEGLVSPEKNS